MHYQTRLRQTTSRIVLAMSVGLVLGVSASAQIESSDAEVETSVLKALAGAVQLNGERITPTTVHGVVTLSGVVGNEPSRQLAEDLASRVTGVKKVVDELVITSEQVSTDRIQATNPLLQSDGTMATAIPSQASEGQQAHAPDPDTYAAQHSSMPEGQPGQSVAGTETAAAARRRPYMPGVSKAQVAQDDQQAGQMRGQESSPVQPYPQQPGSQPYSPNGNLRGNVPAAPAYGAQIGGQPVVVPSGSLLRIRINEGLDSKHAQVGDVFDGVLLNDVVAEGAVAIPRGASLMGRVTDAQSGGVLKGRGELALTVNEVTLGGKSFPITSDVWLRDSSAKGLQTVSNAVGLGATGALIGAIAGGGAGAVIGAGIGGAAGVGTSAASGGRQVLVPPEAILTFHLMQPAPVTTVSQAEMDRLSYGVPIGGEQPRMRRRYPPPPPYYGPVYYPRPYGYPYPY